MKRDSCAQMNEDLGQGTPEEGGTKPKANCSAAETGFSADELPGISATRQMEVKNLENKTKFSERFHNEENILLVAGGRVDCISKDENRVC